jgi:hypothetical protein
MRYTTDCTLVFEPQYENVGDLFKSCHKNQKCKNLNISACDYLNESLLEIMDEIIDTEATINAYQVEFFQKDSEGETGFLNLLQGNCTGELLATQRNIVAGSDNLIIRLKICLKD